MTILLMIILAVIIAVIPDLLLIISWIYLVLFSICFGCISRLPCSLRRSREVHFSKRNIIILNVLSFFFCVALWFGLLFGISGINTQNNPDHPITTAELNRQVVGFSIFSAFLILCCFTTFACSIHLADRRSVTKDITIFSTCCCMLVFGVIIFFIIVASLGLDALDAI